MSSGSKTSDKLSLKLVNSIYLDGIVELEREVRV